MAIIIIIFLVVCRRKNTLRVTKPHFIACGVQGGTYFRWSVHMWMSREKERGMTDQPSLLFWRVCSSFFSVALLCRGTAGLGSTIPRRALHTYTLLCHCRPRSGVQIQFLLLLHWRNYFYLLLADATLSGVSL
ncbi:hypothetical protein Tc00.1047053503495.5 [Trypanosoma cruzi]|uniref:Secreted protein n=1 Tax=Trypanosoma cruzi (strain CL Brener) TaxID=353153 RepID=Q4D1D8_TRYCC|nr:hypothetical protein Tc00.1047053503495.5 [Trypanosoma cruzi]EAN86340.1 hypothetical protein Tc00.1047053503495.5 [Trypanosoma cruzi]|eukprot:XP_808191.1 hypothetical protein [Trypanosoma cruzi strain CL Brener]